MNKDHQQHKIPIQKLKEDSYQQQNPENKNKNIIHSASQDKKQKQIYEQNTGIQNIDSENTSTVQDDNNQNHKQKLLNQKTVKTIRTSWVRWVILLFACLVMMGFQASQDSPSVLQDHLYEDMFNFINKRDGDNLTFKTEVSVKYSWIFSIGSLTSSIFPFFIGIIVVKLGVRKLLIIFLSIVALGQLFCSFAGVFAGGWQNSASYIYFLLGRFFLFLGVDSTTLGIKTFVSYWFYGQEIALALGLPSSINKLGTTIGGWILDSLYNVNESLFLPFFVLACYISFSVLFVLILIFIDKKREYEEHLLLGNDTIKQEKKHSHDFKLKDFKKLNLLFWICVLNYALNFASFQTWSNFANQLLKNQYSIKSKDIGKIITFPSMASAIGIPIAGLLNDLFGKQQFTILLASSSVLLGQILFLTLPQCPLTESQDQECNPLNYWAPTICFGVYKIFSIPATYSSVSMVLEKELFGLGVGALLSVSSFTQFVSMQVEGILIGNTPTSQRGGYLYQQIFNTTMAAIATILALYLIVLNKKRGGNIGLSKKQLEAKFLNQQSEQTNSQNISRTQSSTKQIPEKQLLISEPNIQFQSNYNTDIKGNPIDSIDEDDDDQDELDIAMARSSIQ